MNPTLTKEPRGPLVAIYDRYKQWHGSYELSKTGVAAVCGTFRRNTHIIAI
jgi:hypothetical protein